MHNAIPTQSHSGLGIAALTISLGAGALLVLLMGIAGVLDSQPGGMDENSVAANAIGLAVNYAVYAALLNWGSGWLASPYVAAGCGAIAGLVFNYTASSRLVFRAAPQG